MESSIVNSKNFVLLALVIYLLSKVGGVSKLFHIIVSPENKGIMRHQIIERNVKWWKVKGAKA
jgi:hypothetical protein